MISNWAPGLYLLFLPHASSAFCGCLYERPTVLNIGEAYLFYRWTDEKGDYLRRGFLVKRGCHWECKEEKVGRYYEWIKEYPWCRCKICSTLTQSEPLMNNIYTILKIPCGLELDWILFGHLPNLHIFLVSLVIVKGFLKKTN